MKISSIGETLGNISSLNPQQQNEQVKKEGSFSSMLKDAIGEVNSNQIDGYNAMEGIATGKVKNLQEAVQKIEEADLSLKLALEVKNKAISAYKEISRIQA